MKKIIAVLLSILCLGSCFGFGASAAQNDGLVTDLTSAFEKILDVELPEDEPIGYGVIYTMDPLGFVSVMYKPSPSVSFNNPGTYTITSDTPLSVDYQFVCWKLKGTDKEYRAGDKIYVDGMIYLEAVWEEKNDNDIRITRVIKTALETLKRTIGAFLGILNNFAEFEEDYNNPTTPEEDPTIAKLTGNVDLGLIYDYEKDPCFFTVYILTEVLNPVRPNYVLSEVYFNDTSYPVEMTISDETVLVGGKPCQFIEYKFVDGVPAPERGVRLTFTIPKAFLTSESGLINAAYSGSFVTSKIV